MTSFLVVLLAPFAASASICGYVSPEHAPELTDDIVDKVCRLQGLHEQVLWANGYDDCTGEKGQAQWQAELEERSGIQNLARMFVDGTLPTTPEQMERWRYIAARELDALTVMVSYIATGYRRINAVLSNGKRPAECLSGLTERLVRDFGSMPAHPGVVWRGLGLSTAELLPYRTVGAELTWPAFSSTSTDRSVAEQYARRSAERGLTPVLLQIRSNDCRKVLVNHLSEEEILCMPGTRVRVTRFEMRGGMARVSLSQVN